MPVVYCMTVFSVYMWHNVALSQCIVGVVLIECMAQC